MRYSFLHEIFYYTQYYVLFFSFYQFTGANSYITASAANLAGSVIVMLAYSTWMVIIAYLASKYRKQALPKKFSFLQI